MKGHKLDSDINLIHASSSMTKNTATQTDETTLEVARLEEQIKLMSIEIMVLRKHVAKDPSCTIKDYSPPKIFNVDKALTDKNEQIEPEVQEYPEGSLKTPGRSGTRGCTCKGNCSSKRCGCVKKGNICAKSCSCNNASCQNQEPKERNEKERSDAKGNKKRSQKNVTKDYDISMKENINSAEVLTMRRQTYKLPINDVPRSPDEQEKDILSLTDSPKRVSHETDIFNDSSFDPTKPRHQLARTPVKCGTKSTPIVSDSSSPLSVLNMEIKIEETENHSAPAELTESEVDWEKYQSILVPCKKCKRKFHPLRLKKHESCCKRI